MRCKVSLVLRKITPITFFKCGYCVVFVSKVVLKRKGGTLFTGDTYISVFMKIGAYFEAVFKASVLLGFRVLFWFPRPHTVHSNQIRW